MSAYFGEEDLAAYLAEFLGTMFFQMLGGGSSEGVYNGLVLMVLIFCTAEVSGGHLNPAVSFGLAVGGEMPWMKCLAYIVMQLVGAIIGALLCVGLYYESSYIGDYSANRYGVAYNSISLREGGASGILNEGSGCPVPFHYGRFGDEGTIRENLRKCVSRSCAVWPRSI